jgi:hypothetical protein
MLEIPGLGPHTFRLYSDKFPSFYYPDGNVLGLQTYEISPVFFSKDIKYTFNTINTLGNDFVCKTASVFNDRIDPITSRKSSSKRDLSRRDKSGMSKKIELAYSICCAYSALVMAYAFVKARTYCFEFGQQIKDVDVCMKKFLNGLQTGTYANEENKTILLEIERLHMGINGYNREGTNVYGNESIISRSNNCPPEHPMLTEDGVYLFSIVSNFHTRTDGREGCGTAHHFMVYKINNYCIIYDTWLGGYQGNRCNWTRIISTEQFIFLINLMNDPRTSVDEKEFIILMIFAGPNKNGAGYHDPLYNYQFRYYSEPEFAELIDKNTELVRDYIQQYPPLQYHKGTQKHFQRQVYQPQLQPPVVQPQPQPQSSLGKQQRRNENNDASVPVNFDMDLIDEMAGMPLEESESQQPAKKFKENVPESVPPGFSLINPSEINSSRSSPVSSPVQLSPFNMSPSPSGSPGLGFGSPFSPSGSSGLGFGSPFSPSGGSRKLKRNKRKSTHRNKRKSTHRNKRKSKRMHRNKRKKNKT